MEEGYEELDLFEFCRAEYQLKVYWELQELQRAIDLQLWERQIEGILECKF